MPHTNNKHTPGFTLIEILIVITIIGLLASIALPSYRHYLIKSKRAEGRAALMQVMQQQMHYFFQYRHYRPFEGNHDETIFKWFSSNTAERSAYQINATRCHDADLPNCIQLQAIPGTNNVDTNFHDPDCGTLTLDSLGRKNATGKIASRQPNDCW